MGSPCVDRHQSRWSLGFRNVLCEDGDDAYAAAMCCHHHSQSLIFAYVKFRLQNRDDEIAGGKSSLTRMTLWRRGRSTFISSAIFGLVMMSVIGVTVPWTWRTPHRMRASASGNQGPACRPRSTHIKVPAPSKLRPANYFGCLTGA